MEALYILPLYFTIAASQLCPLRSIPSYGFEFYHIKIGNRGKSVVETADDIKDCLMKKCKVKGKCVPGCAVAYKAEEEDNCVRININCQLLVWYEEQGRIAPDKGPWKTACVPHNQWLSLPAVGHVFDHVFKGMNIGHKGSFCDATETHTAYVKIFKKRRKETMRAVNFFTTTTSKPEFINLLHGGKPRLKLSDNFTWMTWLALEPNIIKSSENEKTINLWKGNPGGFAITLTIGRVSRKAYTVSLSLYISQSNFYLTEPKPLSKRRSSIKRFYNYAVVFSKDETPTFYFDGKVMTPGYESGAHQSINQPNYISVFSDFVDDVVPFSSVPSRTQVSILCTLYFQQKLSEQQIKDAINRCP